jgi:hypothetical protein
MITQTYLARESFLWIYSRPVEGASFRVSASCCLDSVVIVANNSNSSVFDAVQRIWGPAHSQPHSLVRHSLALPTLRETVSNKLRDVPERVSEGSECMHPMQQVCAVTQT